MKILFGIATLFVWLISPVLAAPNLAPPQRGTALNFQWVEEVFVDYSHAGPGPHPTNESDKFHLTQGGIRWFSGGPVQYRITGTEDTTGGNTAIVNAEDTIDGFVTTRVFTRNDSTAQINPCTGSPNTVEWGTIDGAGEALATASVCRNVATKEIGGFVITIDTAETWSTIGASTAFDVENVAAHELGHVAGLDHTNAPKDGCLTMYRFAGTEEIQKRTLGLGDKLGMNILYSSTDVTAGSCGS